MAERIQDVMSRDPVTVQATSTVREAAEAMRDRGVGDVIVLRDDGICGIVTDRDITVRAVAEGRDPSQVRVGDICSRELEFLSPGDTVDDAVRIMRERAIRRLPVVDGGRPVGVVSIGDLALERDPNSALADISAAPPNT